MKQEKILLGEVIEYLYANNQTLFQMLANYLAKRYLKPFIDLIKDVNIIKKDILDVLREIPYCNSDLSLQLTHYFKTSDFLDKSFPEISFTKEYESFILDTTNDMELRYSLFYDLLLRTFTKNKDVDTITKLYKVLYEEIKQKIEIQKGLVSNDDKRVFIFTLQYLDILTHAPSNQARLWAKMFDKMGYKVIIVSTTPLPFPYKLSQIHMPFNQNNIPNGEIAELYDNSFVIELSGNPLHNNNIEEFCQGLQLNNNDTFLTIGQRCIAFDILPFERKFLVPTSANIVFTTANVALANRDLGFKNNKGELLDFILSTNDFTLSGELEFKPVNIDMTKTLNLITVGHRLDEEIDENFWNGLEKLYKKIPNIQLFLVGKYKSNIPENLKAIVTCAGFQSNLQEFFEGKHIFLNPKRSGGGQSALLALKMGMPVITLDVGDVANIMKHKYFIKDFKQIESFVSDYINNKEFKTKIDTFNKEIFDISAFSEEKFLEVCQKIIDYKR